MQIDRVVPLALLLAVLAGCGPEADIDIAETEVIYGADDRRDLYELDTNDPLRRLFQSSAAIIDASRVTAADNDFIVDTALTFNVSTQQRYGRNLCGAEPFRAQPVTAFCSAFVIGRDLIATAGHCVENTCGNERFVFGFTMDDATTPVRRVNRNDVYSCAQVVGRVNENNLDWAVVRVERNFVNHPPLPLRTSSRIEGDDEVAEIGVLGHPMGLPAKLSLGAEYQGGSSFQFQANVDTYGGNSGSMIVSLHDDGTLNAVEGILVSGQQDLRLNGACIESNRCADTGCAGGFETATRVTVFTRAICGRNACACSDGICNPDCAADIDCERPNGTTVTAAGTSGADSYRLRFTGRAYQLRHGSTLVRSGDRNTLGTIMVDGRAGRDYLTIQLSPYSDVVDFEPGRVLVFSGGMRTEIQTTGIERVIVQGSGGVTDLATLRGDDQQTFYDARSDRAILRGPRVGSDYAYYVDVRGFRKVEATAGNHPSDLVYFRDSGDRDLFVARPGAESLMRSNDSSHPTPFHNTATGFERLYALSDGAGTDTAHLYGTAGDDSLRANDGRGNFSGPGFYVYYRGIDTLSVVSDQGGTDTARFYDTPASDVIIAQPLTVSMRSGSQRRWTRGFDTHSFIGNASYNDNDRLILYDGSGDDELRMNGTSLIMSGPTTWRGETYTYRNWANNNIEQVVAYSRRGGVDTLDIRSPSQFESFTTNGDWR